MNLSEIGVKKPVTTAMIFIGIVLLGGISLSRMGLDMMPDIEVPSIMVITEYEGAGPEEVETRITRVAEDRLTTVEDLDRIEGFSQEGISVITLRFNWGINLDNAVNNVRDQLDLIKPNLPDEAEDPIIFKFDLSMMPVLIYGVTSNEKTYPSLKKLLEDEVAMPLESAPGVASVTVRGGLERAILVELNSQRLKAYNMSVSQVENILKAENLSSPGGNIKTGMIDYLVRVPAELKIQEIEDVVISTYNGIPIKIKDIATVKDAFKELTQETFVNKRPGIRLMVQKESEANTVNVCREVFARLEKLKKNLPPDVEFSIISDSSDQVVKSINNLKNTILLGGVLVIIVVFLFLGNFRSSLIISSAIPISLIMTFIFLYIGGYTINIISLSALSIAIGMVVDATIVVYENIHRHLENGEELIKSCIEGGKEVAGAITASVFCIVSIFVPIFFTGGLAAVFFGELAYVCSIAMLASLFTALILIPMLTSKTSTVKKEGAETKKKNLSDIIYFFTNRWFQKMDNSYENFLKWALRYRKRVVFASTIILFGSLFLVKFIGTEFIPETDEGRLSFSIELPIGTRYEKTGEVTKAVEQLLFKEVPEIKVSSSSWGLGEAGVSSLFGGEQGSNIGEVRIKLIDKAQRKRSPRQIAYDIKDKLNIFPGADVRYDASSIGTTLLGTGKPLSVEIRGYDLGIARNLSSKVADILKGIEGVGDVRISRKEGKPEIQVLIDREKASLFGLNATTISDVIETCFEGSVSTYYREAGDEYDIEVRLRKEDRSAIDALENLIVPLPSGRQVSLSQVAKIVKTTGPLKIERKDRERVVKVEGEIYGRALGNVVREAQEKLENLEVPAGFSINFGGEFQEQQKTFKSLGFALILGIILIFMIMASQFESLLDPFVVMFAVPFSLIGVVWALLLSGNTLSIISFLGLIMIVGIGVETGIVLISFIKQLREEGVELHEAVVKAGKLRLRAVCMTTLTTIFGLVPMALSKGEGSEIWVPLGFTIIGGLTVSFLLTLFFIPILYTIFEEKILPRLKNKD